MPRLYDKRTQLFFFWQQSGRIFKAIEILCGVYPGRFFELTIGYGEASFAIGIRTPRGARFLRIFPYLLFRTRMQQRVHERIPGT